MILAGRIFFTGAPGGDVVLRRFAEVGVTATGVLSAGVSSAGVPSADVTWVGPLPSSKQRRELLVFFGRVWAFFVGAPGGVVGLRRFAKVGVDVTSAGLLLLPSSKQ